MPSAAANVFEAMCGERSDRIFHPVGKEAFDAVKMLRAADLAQIILTPNSETG